MTLEIKNVIDEVSDGKKKHRDPSRLNRIAVHRAGIDLKYGHVFGYTAQAVCDVFTGRNKEFAGVAAAIGGHIPYGWMIGGNLGPDEFDGVIWQTLPIHEAGAHARRWTATALGVMLIADPRVKAASDHQRSSLIRLLAVLCEALGVNPSRSDDDGVPFLAGHDELPGGSRDESKRCPGDLLPMPDVRKDVAAMMARQRIAVAKNYLMESGATI